tara:strand:+ start:919 stop:3168 length:2250 start_codon:yes stop_codon:yes gene_type:complete
MKMLFENWRGFVNEQAEIIDFPAPESRGGVKEFNLDIDKLNSAMQRVTDAAKDVLGAEGEAPAFKAEDFQQATQDLRMVAEQEEYSDKPLTGAERAKVVSYGVPESYQKKFKDAVTGKTTTKKIFYKPSEIRSFIARVEAAQLPTGTRALPAGTPAGTSRADLRRQFYQDLPADLERMTGTEIKAAAKKGVAAGEYTTQAAGVKAITAKVIAAQRAAIERMPVGSIKRAKAMRKLRGLEGGLQVIKRDKSLGTTPIGRMKPEDFESQGIVIPVPQYVIKSFRDMIADIKEVDKLYEQAKEWYHSIRKLMDKATSTKDKDGNTVKNDRDGTLLGLMIATYSPRAKFALNLAEAVMAYKAIKVDAKQNPELLKDFVHSFPKKIKTTKRKGKPFSQFDDMKGVRRGWREAHKVPNFALNLIAPNLALGGDAEDRTEDSIEINDMYFWNSTIDTWMIDAFYPTLRAASTAKEWGTIKGDIMSNVVSYRYLAGIVAREAKALGILPQELQAIIWVASQRNQQGDLNTGTVEQAFDDIKKSIESLTEIEEGLADLIQYDRDDWMGNIVRTIDSKKDDKGNPTQRGFEMAARYLTEPQTGIRSRTARGKKGTEYPYLAAIDDEEDLNESGHEEEKEEKRVYDEKDYETFWLNPKFEDLKLYWVMKNVIQMNTGKFSNLHDSVLLYLEEDFDRQKAIDYILGRFDDKDAGTGDYFQKDIYSVGRGKSAPIKVRPIRGDEVELSEKLDRIAEELRRMR